MNLQKGSVLFTAAYAEGIQVQISNFIRKILIDNYFINSIDQFDTSDVEFEIISDETLAKLEKLKRIEEGE